MTAPVVITVATARQAAESIEALADVLVDCVEGGASVGFLWPLQRATATAFWRGVADGVARGERVLLLACEAAADGPGAIVGTVQLILALPQNQPHRADLAKMLVHRQARRRGVARQLLAHAEAVAREHRRSVLVLDTVSGGAAERLYARAGWLRVGTVPNYALMPNGQPCATTIFHRPLQPQADAIQAASVPAVK